MWGVLRLAFESAEKGARNERGKEMKYILMMNGSKANWDEYGKWSQEDLQRNIAFMRAFSKELRDAGVFVATEGLDWPNEAKIVRAGKDGEPVTDGVFPESKEFLAGYWIIDVESPEQAYKLAARASGGAWARRKASEHAHRGAASAEQRIRFGALMSDNLSAGVTSEPLGVRVGTCCGS